MLERCFCGLAGDNNGHWPKHSPPFPIQMVAFGAVYENVTRATIADVGAIDLSEKFRSFPSASELGFKLAQTDDSNLSHEPRYA